MQYSVKLKETIRSRFDNASRSYEQAASVQKECAIILTRLLLDNFDNFDPKNIFDIGTGTGYLPEILLPRYPEASYILNDISPNMLEVAKEKFAGRENFSYIGADVEESAISKYCLIISNFSLQWIYNFEKLIKNLFSKSKILAFTCLLDNSFNEWDKRLQAYGLSGVIKKYPTKDYMLNFLQKLEPYKLYTETQNFSLTFKCPIDLMRYLKKIGAGTPAAAPDLIKFRRFVEKDREHCVLNYEVMFILAENNV